MILKLSLVFFTALSFVRPASAAELTNSFPHNQSYVALDWYPTLFHTIPAPPKMSDPQQKEDEDALFKLQDNRTAADCQRANSEVRLSLDSFYGAPYGPLDNKTIATLSPFFLKIRNDAEPFIHHLKSDFHRPRPYLYLHDLKPCLPMEGNNAYPSGHASLAKLFSLVLVDLIPTKKVELEARAAQIAGDRVLGGVHHPSDIAAGAIVGTTLYSQYKRSTDFRTDFEKYRRLLSLSPQ